MQADRFPQPAFSYVFILLTFDLLAGDALHPLQISLLLLLVDDIPELLQFILNPVHLQQYVVGVKFGGGPFGSLVTEFLIKLFRFFVQAFGLFPHIFL